MGVLAQFCKNETATMFFLKKPSLVSGSYGGHRRHTTDDGRRTTPGV